MGQNLLVKHSSQTVHQVLEIMDDSQTEQLLGVVKFEKVSFQGFLKGCGGRDVPNGRWKGVPLLWSGECKSTLTKRFGSNPGDREQAMI